MRSILPELNPKDEGYERFMTRVIITSTLAAAIVLAITATIFIFVYTG